ncbi:leucine-rich melanocyte differentiation-associated protein [Pelomyxa schiedti]|nr:leucine-rich melanocyte differentiation-associated protein [Pelomyxa schiedti]
MSTTTTSSEAPAEGDDGTAVEFVVVRPGVVVAGGRDLVEIPAPLVAMGSRVHELDLSSNSLVSTQGLQHFTSLKELTLDGNTISDVSHLPNCPTLKLLSLNKNNVNDLEEFLDIVSTRLPNLTNLGLVNNPACPFFGDEKDYSFYRMRVIYRLPSLMILDSIPVTPAERAESRKRGEFCKINKPVASTKPVSAPVSTYSPLPPPVEAGKAYNSVYTRQSYKYVGKESQGNRFIGNDNT